MDTPLATIYTGWESYQRLLADAIAPLHEHQLRLAAAPGLWPVRRLASHIVQGRVFWFHGWMREGGPEFDALCAFDRDEASERRSAPEIVAALETTWSLLDGCLRRWSAADLDERFPDPWPDPADPEPWRDRRYMVWHVLEHDLHHGGEISFTLGMHGITGIDL